MVKYLWKREPKLGIHPARNPVEGLALSGVVLIIEQGKGFAYVKFDQEAVEKLGRRMPVGIGPANTAYLKIVKKHGHYDVICAYTDNTKSVYLWKSEKLPVWVRKVRHAEESA